MNKEELKEMLKLYTKQDLWEFNQIKAKKQIELMAQIKEKDQKIQELEHRLSNCIEPKFKQGDKCYVIETRYVNVVEYFVVNEVEYFGENIDGIITFEEGCRCGCTPDRYSVEKRENVFATEEEARKKLEELKK